MRRDLRRGSPTRDLVERNRPEGASVLVFAKKPLLVHRRFRCPLRRRRAGRGRRCRRNSDGLAGLQFTAVFDMVGFLQIVHGHLVHFRDRCERFSARNSVHVAFDGGMRRRGSRSGSGCWSGCRFSDHYPWLGMRELLLQFENLLRKRVDPGVLFVNLFCQSFQLRGFR